MTTNLNNDCTLTKPLQIFTLNVNGLHNDNNRMEIFQNLINKNVDIIFLQETHSTPEASTKWEKEWKVNPFDTQERFQKRQGWQYFLRKT